MCYDYPEYNVIMRTRVLLFIAVLYLAIPRIFAQQNQTEVVAAFKKGCSKELVKWMNEKVNLVILNQEFDVDKRKAIAIIDDFFAVNKVEGFAVVHQGQRGESGFVIGLLSTSNGKFRVNCFLKKEPDNYLIHQIRIDKTNE